jgi:hypothetical protein
MSAPAPSQSANDKPVRKRSPLERAIVWGGILCLLFIVAMEQTSRTNYGSSLKTLEEAMLAREPNGMRRGLLAADVGKFIRGFATRRDEISNDRPKIVFRWPSLFKTYQISLIAEFDNRITRIDSADSVVEKDTDAKVNRVEPPKLPERGLIEDAAQIVALQDFPNHLAIGKVKPQQE